MKLLLDQTTNGSFLVNRHLPNFNIMIEVSKNLVLEDIIESDCESLFNLMQEIYPSAYHQFWDDKGEWYVNSQYSMVREFSIFKRECFKGNIRR